MDTSTYIRKPLVVEVVEVTTDNIRDLSKQIGKLQYDENHTPFIMVDKKIVPSGYKVFPGYFVTFLGKKIHCYSEKVFAEQFLEGTEERLTLLQLLEGATSTDIPEIVELPQPAANTETPEVIEPA